MQLRYGFRLYPNGPQRSAPARALGCARVVFNDPLRVREDARTAGLPFVASGELTSVILQQSLRDLDTAYRNFFDSLKGKRPKMGPPRFKPKRDTRQAIRSTANAGWKITPSGKLRLPKAGDVPVKWSRTLPSPPTTVTVINQAVRRHPAGPANRAVPGGLRVNTGTRRAASGVCHG